MTHLHPRTKLVLAAVLAALASGASAESAKPADMTAPAFAGHLAALQKAGLVTTGGAA